VRLLLDTHVVLWQLSGSQPIGTAALEEIRNADELLFSVVSFAEIGVKAAIGKLSVPADLRERVLDAGIQVLGLAPDHGLDVARLPMHHRDPFDRLLIAQARSEGLTMMTADARIPAYDVRTVDASR
jgi:PIN domain nuclease of toxin-antitoxin system